MNRYSGGHNILKIGAYLAPLAPMGLMTLVYPDPPYLANAPDIVILWIVGGVISYAMIAIHEFGHAIAARLAGIGIASITIGHWRRIFGFMIGRTVITVRAAPATGYVVFEQTAALLSVPRTSATLLAGVFAEAVFVCWLATTSGPAAITSMATLATGYVRLDVFWIGGLHVFFNMIPAVGRVAGTEHATDGLQLLKLWRSRKQLPAHRELLAELKAIERLFKDRKISEAIGLLEPLATRHPENIGLVQYLGQLYAENGNTQKAEVVCRDLLQKPIGSQKLAETLDQLCCLVLYYGRTDLVVEADAWSSEAIAYARDAITLKGTRGAMLIELGRFDEGVALLRKVAGKSECSTDRLISYSYLAKASAIRGDIAEARRCLDKAVATNPDHIVVKRIRAELPPMLARQPDASCRKGDDR